MSIECLTFTVQSLYFSNHVSLITLLAVVFTLQGRKLQVRFLMGTLGCLLT